jgi:hypothetical protein
LLELHHQPAQNGNEYGTGSSDYLQQYQEQGHQKESASPISNLSISIYGNNQPSQYSKAYLESPGTSYGNGSYSAKRKRGDIELNVEVGLDIVSIGLISLEDAGVYFRTFFQGCVRFTLF